MINLPKWCAGNREVFERYLPYVRLPSLVNPLNTKDVGIPTAQLLDLLRKRERETCLFIAQHSPLLGESVGEFFRETYKRFKEPAGPNVTFNPSGLERFKAYKKSLGSLDTFTSEDYEQHRQAVILAFQPVDARRTIEYDPARDQEDGTRLEPGQYPRPPSRVQERLMKHFQERAFRATVRLASERNRVRDEESLYTIDSNQNIKKKVKSTTIDPDWYEVEQPDERADEEFEEEAKSEASSLPPMGSIMRPPAIIPPVIIPPPRTIPPRAQWGFLDTAAQRSQTLPVSVGGLAIPSQPPSIDPSSPTTVSDFEEERRRRGAAFPPLATLFDAEVANNIENREHGIINLQDHVDFATMIEDNEEAPPQNQIAIAIAQMQMADHNPLWDKIVAARADFDVATPLSCAAFLDYLNVYAYKDIKDNQGRFLRVFGYFLPAGPAPEDNHATALFSNYREAAQLLGGQNINWWALFRFFAVLNNETLQDPQYEGKHHEWIEGAENVVRRNVLGLLPELVENVSSARDFMLRRTTRGQQQLAIEMTVAEIATRDGTTAESIRIAIREGDDRGTTDAMNTDDDRLSQELLRDIWNYFLTIILAMRFFWSYSVAIPDLLLKQHNYMKIQLRPILEELRVTAVTPFMICNDEALNDKVENNFSLRALYCKNIVKKFSDIRVEGYEKLFFTVKMKRVYFTLPISERPARTEDDSRLHLNERWFIIKPNLFRVVIDHTLGEAALNRSIENAEFYNDLNQTIGVKNDAAAFAQLQLCLTHIANMSDLAWENWLKEEILRLCRLGDKLYRNHDIEQEGEDPLDKSLMVHSFYYMAKHPQMKKLLANENPNNFAREIRCFKSKFRHFSVLDKLVEMSEVRENFQICLYEAVWTALNKDNFRTRMFNNKSIWHMDVRGKALYTDFCAEPLEFQDICISGNFDAWFCYISRTYRNRFQVINLDKIDNSFEIDRDRYQIVFYMNHCVFASQTKLITYIGNLQRDRKRTSGELKALEEKRQANIYKVKRRKAWTQQDTEEYIEVFFDIECYLNDEKRFVPYLICTTSEHDEFNKTFWGADICVADFIGWFQTFAKPQNGLSHHGEQKFIFWGFNSARFDIIFLLPRLAQLGFFELKGEFVSPKYIKSGNVQFLDLIQLVKGKMTEQQDFWGTTKKKKDMEHNLTPDSFRELPQTEIDRIIDYCQNDCEVLREMVQKYKEFVSEFPVSPYQTSTAALSLAVYKTTQFCTDGQITGTTHDMYNIHKKSYFGGVCERYNAFFPDNLIKDASPESMIKISLVDYNTRASQFVEGFGGIEPAKAFTNDDYATLNLDEQEEEMRRRQKIPSREELFLKFGQTYVKPQQGEEKPRIRTDKVLYYYDINSAYPTQMKKQMPVRDNTKMTRLTHFIALSSKNDAAWIQPLYLYRCQDLRWDDSTQIPIFPKRTQNGLIYGLEHSEEHYIWGEELIFALNTGLIIEGLVTHQQTFVWGYCFNKYIDYFYEARKKAKQVKDTVKTGLYKLLMNSLYGKFGQRRFPQTSYIPACQLEDFVARFKDEIWEINEFGPDLFEIIHQDEEPDIQDIAYCVRIPSYITMKQRLEIRKAQYKILEMGGKLYYTDTDSIVCDMELPPDWCDELELGKWKLEDKLIEAMFVMPKAYFYINDAGDYVMKFKGLKTETLTREHYERLLCGQKIKFDSGFIWNRKYDKKAEEFDNGFVVVVPNIKVVTPSSKREFDIETGCSKPK